MQHASKSASVKELLSNPTFLQRLEPLERWDLLRSQRGATCDNSPQCAAIRSYTATAWGISSKHHKEDLDCKGTQQCFANRICSAKKASNQCDGSEPHCDKQHTPCDTMSPVEQHAQLLSEVDGLQQQLLGMQKQQQQQSHEPADAVSQAVIASLRASVNQVSTMASSVSQENKALASDNKRLSHQRDQLNNTIKQLQDRIRQLEHGLLQQLEESQQHALHRAEDAALCTRLQTLLGDGALTDTAVEAMLHSSPVAPSVLLEELSSSSKQLRPLLNELSALRRSQQSLQKQVLQLQQQLVTAERDAQTAAVSAAGERARAGRMIKQAHQRLSVSLQRLQALASKQQQQSSELQEREAYIARLERCLVQQNRELQQLASSASRSKQNLRGRCVSPASGISINTKAAGRPHSSKDSGRAAAQQGADVSTAGQVSCRSARHQASDEQGQRHYSDSIHKPSLSQQSVQQLQQQQQQEQQCSPAMQPNHHLHHTGLTKPDLCRQQQQHKVGGSGYNASGRNVSPDLASKFPDDAASPAALAVSRAAVALQCREIMARSAVHDADGQLSTSAAVTPDATPNNSAGPASADKDIHVRHSSSPGFDVVQQQGKQMLDVVSELPSFTAASSGRPSAGIRARDAAQPASSKSISTAGAAAKRIAAATAAVSALGKGKRGLWGSQATLKHSSLTAARRMSPQEQQQQRQLRLRELLQQKQRRASTPQQPGAQRLGSADTQAGCEDSEAQQQRRLSARRAAAAQDRWRRHQQQQHLGQAAGEVALATCPEDFSEAETAASEQNPEGGASVAAVGHAVVASGEQWQQQRQPFGFRSTSAPPAAACVPGVPAAVCSQPQHETAEELVADKAQPVPVVCFDPHSSNSALESAWTEPAIEQAQPRDETFFYDHFNGESAQEQRLKGAAAVLVGEAAAVRSQEGDGLMSEVLAMQRDLQELEEELMHLGCEIEA